MHPWAAAATLPRSERKPNKKPLWTMHTCCCWRGRIGCNDTWSALCKKLFVLHALATAGKEEDGVKGRSRRRRIFFRRDDRFWSLNWTKRNRCWSMKTVLLRLLTVQLFLFTDKRRWLLKMEVVHARVEFLFFRSQNLFQAQFGYCSSLTLHSYFWRLKNRARFATRVWLNQLPVYSVCPISTITVDVFIYKMFA